jgi:Tol biopolymer transport system component
LRVGKSATNQSNLWLLDLARDGAATKFTFAAAVDFFPVWSPDGSQIVFASNRDGVYNLYRKSANGAKDEERFLKSDLPKYPLSWSNDGRFLLFRLIDHETSNDLWILPEPGSAPGGAPTDAVPGNGGQRNGRPVFAGWPLDRLCVG